MDSVIALVGILAVLTCCSVAVSIRAEQQARRGHDTLDHWCCYRTANGPAIPSARCTICNSSALSDKGTEQPS